VSGPDGGSANLEANDRDFPPREIPPFEPLIRLAWGDAYRDLNLATLSKQSLLSWQISRSWGFEFSPVQ
jgi:hypothetical protein